MYTEMYRHMQKTATNVYKCKQTVNRFLTSSINSYMFTDSYNDVSQGVAQLKTQCMHAVHSETIETQWNTAAF